MSEEREVLDTATGRMISLAEAIKTDVPANVETRRQRKARLARVLERGVVGDRLQVELPPNVYGEWVPNDKSEIFRMQSLGFEIDTEYAPKRALHDQGDGRSVVGDAVFMTCDRETKDILEEIRRENFERANGNPDDPTAEQLEEREFATQNSKIGMPVVEESKQRQARKEHLEAVLQRNSGAGIEVKPAATIIK